jgi:hypothetical protein
MKKIVTTALFSVLCLFVFGQSIHILNGTTDVTNSFFVVPIHDGDMTLTELSIVNKTATRFTYQVNRTILNPPMNDSCASLYYCTGVQCYAPQSATTWTPADTGSSIGGNETLPNGPDTYGIAAHYDVCPTTCADLYVMYRVFKTKSGTNDTARVVIKYTCSTGIKENAAALGSLSNAYPNPACTYFSLDYALNAGGKSMIVIYDIFGKKVMETLLPKHEGTISINTDPLVPGLYFYSLLVNGQTAATKQLVITK